MTPEQILEEIYQRAEAQGHTTILTDKTIEQRVDYVSRCVSNRSGVRLLMACLLAKLDRPEVDPRKPYTEIHDSECFSGRFCDERYLTKFISEHRLPVNSTTAFLTPTLRNINQPLTTDRELVGRPRELYASTIQLLADAAENRVSADALFVEAVRVLVQVREENLARMSSLLNSLQSTTGALPLSSEATVSLINQHLACKHASRLPVLVVAAAYEVAGTRLTERLQPLNSHNAADKQTGALGDVEVCLMGDDLTVTAYEMKTRPVTVDDIDGAVSKICRAEKHPDNYLFVTTERIDPAVVAYAANFYEQTDGTEIAILDCIGFLRHFLHLFHRIRGEYLTAYQKLVLAEPDSAVSQTLKEAFLTLRQAAETGE
jgi:hypothetical protein